jgi:hypothetical protein
LGSALQNVTDQIGDTSTSSGASSLGFNSITGENISDRDITMDIAANVATLAPAMQSANATVQTFMAGQAIQVGVAAAVIAGPAVATNVAARGSGWYYAYAGAGAGGVVLGRDPEYLDAAEGMGAQALNASRDVYRFFLNRGEWSTLNTSYLNAQIFRGQQFFLSNPPMGVPQSSSFWMELQHLSNSGIGPEQWKYVPLRLMWY